ncbi:hypothetical protein NEDG_01906 [Nematocida displodere]|uniref:Uncharacterized protein n=1 Tax=Nematocida displodere TaxID=1805483 RepID=A0A177EJ27_9MICR|nr:hypothetical protein NEDG_01906 [Nematocida displodere]
MEWTRFSKKEEKEREEWSTLLSSVQKTGELSIEEAGKQCFLVARERRILLPISGVCNVGETQCLGTHKEYLLNNKRVALILNDRYEMKKFFYLPKILPESLVCFSPGLFAAISKAGDEVVSFTLGGRGGDSEFSIGNYFVCARSECCESLCANEDGIFVLEKESVLFLKPVTG